MIHIERPGSDYDAPITYVTMFCGVQGIIFEDGEIVPTYLDFYTVEHGHKADCAACIAAQAMERSRVIRKRSSA